MADKRNYQWRRRSYFRGFVNFAVLQLMLDNFTRNEAIDFLKDTVETCRAEELLQWWKTEPADENPDDMQPELTSLYRNELKFQLDKKEKQA